MEPRDFMPQCRHVPQMDQGTAQEWLRCLRNNAYAPGSHYKVADLMGMKTPTGMLYFGGVNVECVDHRQTVHSEECALAFMVTALGKRSVIHEAWVLGAPEMLTGPCDHPLADKDGQPCGNCRQQIAGLAKNEDIPIHCLSLNGHDQILSIGYLLPEAFQFDDFDPEAAAERRQAIDALAPEDADTVVSRVIRHGPLSQSEIFTWLDSLESVDYASRIGQAVVISLTNGFHVAGVKVENAAYTGLNAMQSALGIATANFGKVSVERIYTLSKSRRAGMQAGDLIYPLSLPSIQGLNEFVAGLDIPVTLFACSGQSVVMDYAKAAECFSNFAIQSYHIADGHIRAA